MDFELSDRAKDFRERLQAFMDERVYPAEPVYGEQVRAAGQTARPPAGDGGAEGGGAQRGLWNLFLPDAEHGAGPHEPRVRAARRDHGPHDRSPPRRATAPRPTPATWRCCTSSAPTSRRSAGCGRCSTARSAPAFAMTEPDVASSDATNIALRIERDGDELRPQRPQVVDDRRACTRDCRILIVMGKTDPDAHVYAQQSMVLVPLDTPGREDRAHRCRCSATSTPRATASCRSPTCACPQSNLDRRRRAPAS